MQTVQPQLSARPVGRLYSTDTGLQQSIISFFIKKKKEYDCSEFEIVKNVQDPVKESVNQPHSKPKVEQAVGVLDTTVTPSKSRSGIASKSDA